MELLHLPRMEHMAVLLFHSRAFSFPGWTDLRKETGSYLLVKSGAGVLALRIVLSFFEGTVLSAR